MNSFQDGTPLRYPGAKRKASRLLHSLAPFAYREFREPFFGSGTMIIGARAERSWLNDKNPMLMAFWMWFRNQEDAVEQMTGAAEHFQSASDDEIERAFVQARLRVKMYRDPYSYWFLNRFATSAIVSLRRRDVASLSSALKRNGMAPMRRERLIAIRAVLRNEKVMLTCGEYKELLEAPGASVWIYIDPPYLLKNNGSPIYEFPFSPQDHIELADRLRRCRHAWMLSNGDSRFIRDLYKGYRIRHRRYTGSMPHRKADRFKTELIITNY